MSSDDLFGQHGVSALECWPPDVFGFNPRLGEAFKLSVGQTRVYARVPPPGIRWQSFGVEPRPLFLCAPAILFTERGLKVSKKKCCRSFWLRFSIGALDEKSRVHQRVPHRGILSQVPHSRLLFVKLFRPFFSLERCLPAQDAILAKDFPQSLIRSERPQILYPLPDTTSFRALKKLGMKQKSK